MKISFFSKHRHIIIIGIIVFFVGIYHENLRQLYHFILANDKKVEIYLIPFAISFGDGNEESEVTGFVQSSCEIDLQQFRQVLDNDLSQTHAGQSYNPFNVQGKFMFNGKTYYIDEDGILNQRFESFIHVNKQKLTVIHVSNHCYQYQR